MYLKQAVLSVTATFKILGAGMLEPVFISSMGHRSYALSIIKNSHLDLLIMYLLTQTSVSCVRTH